MPSFSIAYADIPNNLVLVRFSPAHKWWWIVHVPPRPAFLTRHQAGKVCPCLSRWLKFLLSEGAGSLHYRSLLGRDIRGGFSENTFHHSPLGMSFQKQALRIDLLQKAAAAALPVAPHRPEAAGFSCWSPPCSWPCPWVPLSF